MKMRSIVLGVLILSACGIGSATAQAIPVIFDTDMGNDIDDALALAMLHAFESRGEVRILATTSTKDNPDSAPYLDLVNTFYGRPDVPIGVARSGITTNDSPYLKRPLERRRADGSHVYPRDLTHENAPEAVAVLRRTLAAAADTSILVIQVGFSTNLSRLLESPADAVSPLTGRELVMRKVRLLSIMAGDFTHARPDGEYNVVRDIPSARNLFAEWPTALVASGWEIGRALRFPARSIERDYAYVDDHPIAESYRLYRTMPYDRETWDLTSVLWAVRPDDDYFDLSGPGSIEVDEKGITTFRREEGGLHRYLKLGSDAQSHRAVEAMVYLASQPPTR
jgi:inosine-uridine nucleoside N-ribohydrolase